jgi:hypothetical protein
MVVTIGQSRVGQTAARFRTARTKKTAAMSMGMVNCAISALRYSAPKKISCGDFWSPTSMTNPLHHS